MAFGAVVTLVSAFRIPAALAQPEEPRPVPACGYVSADMPAGAAFLAAGTRAELTGTTLTAPQMADSSERRALASFPTPRVRGWQTGLLRPDRIEHASLSFTLAAALVLATRSPGAAAAGVFALGFGKELWDTRGGSGFDAIDLAADATGITLAMVSVHTGATARGQ